MMRNLTRSLCNSRQRMLSAAIAVAAVAAGSIVPAEPITMGSDRELFVDSFLIQELTGAALTLQRPTPREVSVVHDAPWEGNTCGYHTVFQDGPLYRMYYRGSHHPVTADTAKESHAQLVCYAESTDGITWQKPNLGLFDFLGSNENNIVWMGLGTHNFAPFKDANPDCLQEARYKALGSTKGGLAAFQSPDGLHWSLIQKEPVITRGAFDSQNLAFWDTVRKCYVDYHRGFAEGVRAIMTCTSGDFHTWTAPVWVEYVEGTPHEHLYTNQITAYPRAPHILMGFPKRFLPGRRPAGNRMPGLSDGVFMTSRDGLLFKRWQEALIRPGPQRERWVNRNNMTAWGIVETASTIPDCPNELSIYSTEGYYRGDSCQIRRYSLRLDGFVSLNAPMAGGSVLTKAITFTLPSAESADAAATPNSAPVEIVTDAPLRGNASLKVREPIFFRLPNTKDLGEQVTFSVTTRGIPPGHRRLFSAYNGGPVEAGGREFIFDLFSAGCFKVDGVSMRFNYDGVKVFVKKTDLPDWEAVAAGKRPVCFTATWDDGVVKVYMDGAMVGEGGEPGRGSMTLKLGDLHFGEDHKGTSVQNEPFLGLADDIVILRRVLSNADVARLATDGAAAVVNPVADHGIWYSMEAPDSTNLTDRLTADGAADAALPVWGSTRPGDCQLLLNYATSSAGSIRCEVLDAEGNVLPGYSAQDCDEIYGDHIERPVSWNMVTELKQLAGTPIQLRFELKDADLYSIRFGRPEAPAR